MKKICIIQIAGLSHDLTDRYAEQFAPLGLQFEPLVSCFPAVTCTAQATFRTGMPTEEHGVVCNGVYSPDAARVDFWNQSAHLMPAGRIWDDFRKGGGTVGTVCWQQSLGDDIDLILSPAPIHKHHGGMIQAFYSKPDGLYEELCARINTKFNLFRYWGPTTGLGSTRWISRATAEILRTPQMRTDLLLTYLPHLDYILQRQGPVPSSKLDKAVAELVCELRTITEAAREAGYAILLWGDYAITEAKRAIFPNRMLHDAGLMKTRQVGKMLYPDLYGSRAFAMVDHQVAHVYVRNPQDIQAARDIFTTVGGIAEVREHDSMPHERAGDLILVAEEGDWFAYPWWQDNKQAPEFATHVDIHNKIGFDPCELFWGRLFPPSISMDTDKVRGTHGLINTPATWASDLPEKASAPGDLVGLARWLKEFLG